MAWKTQSGTPGRACCRGEPPAILVLPGGFRVTYLNNLCTYARAYLVGPTFITFPPAYLCRLYRHINLEHEVLSVTHRHHLAADQTVGDRGREREIVWPNITTCICMGGSDSRYITQNRLLLGRLGQSSRQPEYQRRALCRGEGGLICLINRTLGDPPLSPSMYVAKESKTAAFKFNMPPTAWPHQTYK